MGVYPIQGGGNRTLNESPSEKEGKYDLPGRHLALLLPSMKVPPKRKGNRSGREATELKTRPLNESPSEKEGKSVWVPYGSLPYISLNESPSEKEGKST